MDTETNTQFCGGAILNIFFVLTAAHCFYERRKIGNDTFPRLYSRNLDKIRIVGGKYSLQWPDDTAQVRLIENV